MFFFSSNWFVFLNQEIKINMSEVHTPQFKVVAFFFCFCCQATVRSYQTPTNTWAQIIIHVNSGKWELGDLIMRKNSKSKTQFLSELRKIWCYPRHPPHVSQTWLSDRLSFPSPTRLGWLTEFLPYLWAAPCFVSGCKIWFIVQRDVGSTKGLGRLSLLGSRATVGRARRQTKKWRP